MNCLEFKEKIFAYLDNELDADASRQFRAHMAGCASCREEVRQYELMQSAVHSLPERECPEELSQKIRAAIDAERAKQKIIPLYKKPWMKTIAAAAAFAVFVGAGSVIFENIFAANSAAPESMKSNVTSNYEIIADVDVSLKEEVSSSGTDLFSASYSAVLDSSAAQDNQAAETESANDKSIAKEPAMAPPANGLPELIPQSPSEPMPSQPQNDPDAPMPDAPAETLPASTKEDMQNVKAMANVRLKVSDTKQARQELAEIAKSLECAAEINEDGLFCIELELLDYDAAYKAISKMKSLEEIEKFISRDKIGEMEYTVLRIWCE